MLDSKLLSDEELRELFSESLSEQEAEAMREADDIAIQHLLISLHEIPDLMIEE